MNVILHPKLNTASKDYKMIGSIIIRNIFILKYKWKFLPSNKQLNSAVYSLNILIQFLKIIDRDCNDHKYLSIISKVNFWIINTHFLIWRNIFHAFVKSKQANFLSLLLMLLVKNNRFSRQIKSFVWRLKSKELHVL